jgi:hypothetical protein
MSPRSTPDAREGHEGQVLPSKSVVVVVVVVVVGGVPTVVDPDRVGARPVLGGGCPGAMVGATNSAACCSSGHRDTQ